MRNDPRKAEKHTTRNSDIRARTGLVGAFPRKGYEKP